MTENQDLIASALQALADKQLSEAYANIEKIAATNPGSAITQHILGLLALYTSEPVEALRFFNAAYELAPSVHEHAEALAITYARLGKLHDALFFAKLSPALPHSPTPGLLPAWIGVFADHFLNIKADPLMQAALALQAEGKFAEAERMFRREITLNPHSMDGWRGLAGTLNNLGRPFDALMALQGLVSAGMVRPWDFATIGHTLARCGRHDQAAALYVHAVHQDPDDAGIGAARLADLRYNPAMTAASLSITAETWRAGTTVPQKTAQPPYFEPLEGRRLRVGLLSGRLSTATAPLNALSMFLQRSEQIGWELTVFNLARQDDALTRRLRHVADDWIDFAEIDDATAALMIENVAVDVLIALDDVGTNSRAGLLLEQPNCLVLSFAQLPAVAAAFGANGVIIDRTLAAGLPASDAIIVTVPSALYGLPEDIWPMLPPRGTDEPRVIGLRASRADLNPVNCAILADLLAAQPDALLLLDASRLGGEGGFEDLLEHFVWYGCSDRIVTMADVPAGEETMQLFAAMDVLLDLGPVNDVESAMAAVLLGRPVATMIGDTPAGRTTASALTGLGLTDWIAKSPAELAAVIGSMLSEDSRDVARQRVIDAVAGGAEARPLARAKALAVALRELVASRQAA